MKPKLVKSLSSLAIRASALLIKLFSMVFFAKTLNEHDFGVYSIFTFFVSFFSILIGLEYFNYNARVLLVGDKSFKPIANQIVFHLTTYIVLLPLCTLIFFFEFLPSNVFLLFFFVLILDHLSQEIIRILIVLDRPVYSTLIFFIKSSLWFIPFILYKQNTVLPNDLSDILIFWLFGQLSSFLLGVVILFRSVPPTKIDWDIRSIVEIKKHLGRALPFLISALSIRGLATFDKVILKEFHGEEAVGILAFYFVIATSIQTIVETGITSINFPDLLRGYNTRNKKTVNSITYYMAASIGSIFVLFLISSFLGLEVILNYLKKSDFYEHQTLMYIYLSAGAITCFTYIPHYKLYAFGHDKLLSILHFSSFIIGVVLYIVLAPIYGLTGIALSFLVSTTILFILKSVFAIRIKF